MPPPLSNHYAKAIVTGASRGIGRAITEMLLEEGVDVWGTARNPQDLPEHPRFHPCQLDLREPSSIAQFLEYLMTECPDPDLLINNAGLGVFAPFEHYPVEAITEQIDVMLTGPVRLCRAFYPVMQRRGQGTIVNISSLASEFPMPLLPMYNAAKAGLSAFTRTLQLESGQSPVNVIDFQPGDYCTEFNQSMQPDLSRASDRTKTIWAEIEKHLNEGPPSEHAARTLRCILQKRRSGRYRCGDFFQVKIAPLFARLITWNWLAKAIRIYYRVT